MHILEFKLRVLNFRHLEKYGCLPAMKSTASIEDHSLRRAVENKIVSINMMREKFRDLRAWGIEFEFIDKFEVLIDPGDTEIDKACALCREESVLKCPSDCTGVHLVPVGSQRVLMATWNEELDLHTVARSWVLPRDLKE